MYRNSNFDDWRNYSAVAQAYLDEAFSTGINFKHRILLGIDYCHAGYSEALGNSGVDPKFGLNIYHPDYAVNMDSLHDFPIVPTNKLIWGWTSVYLQDNIKIKEKLLVTLAGHFTHAPVYFESPDVPVYARETKSNVVSPRFGLTWLFSENLSAYAMYDQSFWPQQGKNIQQEPFKPLSGYDLETGLKGYFFNKKLSLNISVYDIVKNNLVSVNPMNPNYSIQTGQVTSKGIDFDLTGNITSQLSVNMNYAYVDAKVTKDSDPNRIGMKNFGAPDNAFNLWVKYKIPRGIFRKISLAAGYQYMGKRAAELDWPADGIAMFLPAYNLLDLGVSYRTEKFFIAFNMYNLTDTHYASLGFSTPTTMNGDTHRVTRLILE